MPQTLTFEEAREALDRPPVKLPGGKVATVRSIGVGDDQGEWVIPTIVGGKPVDNATAIQLWQQGKNKPLGGPFATIEEANAFAEQFHVEQSKRADVQQASAPAQGPRTLTFEEAAAGRDVGPQTITFEQAQENEKSDWLGIGEEVRGVGRGLERGLHRTIQASDIHALTGIPYWQGKVEEAKKALADFDQQFPGVTSRSNETGWRWRLNQVSKIGQYEGELANAVKIAPDVAESLGAHEKSIEKLPGTKAEQEFHKPESSALSFFRNPVEIAATTTAESLPAMGKGLIGAPFGRAGVAAGMAASSYEAEQGARVTALLQKQGIDVKDPQAVVAYFVEKAKTDPELAKAQMAAYGPAAFDALTGGLAGLILKRAIGGGVKKVAAATAAEIAEQMAGGGIGSIVGSKLAGEPIDWKDVLLEVAAELAPGEAVSNVLSEGRATPTETPTGPPTETPAGLLKPPTKELAPAGKRPTVAPQGTMEGRPGLTQVATAFEAAIAELSKKTGVSEPELVKTVVDAVAPGTTLPTPGLAGEGLEGAAKPPSEPSVSIPAPSSEAGKVDTTPEPPSEVSGTVKKERPFPKPDKAGRLQQLRSFTDPTPEEVVERDRLSAESDLANKQSEAMRVQLEKMRAEAAAAEAKAKLPAKPPLAKIIEQGPLDLDDNLKIGDWDFQVRKAVQDKHEDAAKQLIARLPPINPNKAPRFQSTLWSFTSPSRIGSTFIDQMPTQDGTPLWQWRNALQQAKPFPPVQSTTPAQKGGEPAESIKPKAKGKRFLIKSRSDGVFDILDAIQSLGGLQPPQKGYAGKGGEYDGWKEAMKATARLLINREAAHRPDTIIAELHSLTDEGLGNFKHIQNADDLYAEITSTIKERDNLRASGGDEHARLLRFWNAATSPKNKSGLVKISSNQLNQGHKFRLKGPEISHEEFEVVKVEEDGTVVVKDGPKIGVQDLPENTEIWIQRRGAPADIVQEVKPAVVTQPKAAPVTPVKPVEAAPKERVESAGSRFRPREKVIFDKPLVGPNGNALIAYEWKWMPEEYVDKRGEDRVRRVSNWEEAEASSESGRDLVHQFVVRTPDGDRLVSSESVPALLGYTERAVGTRLPSLISATKTLAKQRMKLAIVKAKIAEAERIRAEVNKLPLPPIEGPEPAISIVGVKKGQQFGNYWKMGNVDVLQHDLGPIAQERREALASTWRDREFRARGGEHVWESVRDLERRIRRQQEKIEDITGGTKFAAGDADLFGAPESVEDQRRRQARETIEAEERAKREANEARQASAKRKLLERAGQRIGGDMGSAGQGGLFEEPGEQELFRPKAPTRPRTFPSYHIDELRAFVANPETSPESRAKMIEEIAARESGESKQRVTPQVPSAPRPEKPSTPQQGGLFAGGRKRGRGLSVQEATDTLLRVLGVSELPRGITVVRDERARWGARIDNRNRITVNAAQISTPQRLERVILEEGLHGVWFDPDVQKAWQGIRDSVTPADIEAERALREKQGLPVDTETLREEAAISKLIEADANRGLIARLYDALRKAWKRVFGFDLPHGYEQALKDAAVDFLQGMSKEQAMQQPQFGVGEGVEDDPKTWGLSMKDVDEMVERFYQKNSEIYDSRAEFYGHDPDEMGMELDSDFETYNRYLKKLPENVQAPDLLRAWKAKELPLSVEKPAGTAPVETAEGSFTPVGNIGEPVKTARLDDAALQAEFDTASRRATKANSKETAEARHNIFMQWVAYPDTAERVGLTPAQLNKKIRSWTNFPATSAVLENRLNHGRPEVSQWTGITNSAFLASADIEAADIDAQFRSVKASKNSGWYTIDGASLRRYLLRTLQAIDTRIDWRHLALEIDSTIKPLGVFFRQEWLIRMRENSPHTVAHELGHFLDYKWAAEAYPTGVIPASELADSMNFAVAGVSPKRAQWLKRFQEFVMDISERSMVTSEYLQARHEVFARFMAKFVDWTNEKAGRRTWGEQRYFDRFHEGDFTRFIRLLQEKAYVDSVEPANKLPKPTKRGSTPVEERFAAGEFDEPSPFDEGAEEAPSGDWQATRDQLTAASSNLVELLNQLRRAGGRRNATVELKNQVNEAQDRVKELTAQLRAQPGYVRDLLTQLQNATDPLELESLRGDLTMIDSNLLNRVYLEMQQSGAIPASQSLPEPFSSLQALTDWLKAHDIDSPKRPWSERLDLARRAAEKIVAVRDLFKHYWARSVALGRAAWEVYKHPSTDNDFMHLMRAWNLADERTGMETHRWVKVVRDAIEDPRRRAGVMAWIQAGGDTATLQAQLAQVPDQYRPIWEAALNLTLSEKEMANRIRADWRDKLEIGMNAGLIERGRLNYGPTVWKVPPPTPDPTFETATARRPRRGTPGNPNARLDPRDPFFSFQKSYPTFFDGIIAGGIPRSMDVADMVGHYNVAFNKAISSRTVIKQLMDARAKDNRPVVILSGRAEPLGTHGNARGILIDPKYKGKEAVTEDGRPYEIIDHFALQNWKFLTRTESGAPVISRADMLVHPDHADFLRNVLGKQYRDKAGNTYDSPIRKYRVGRGILKVNRFLKESKFALSPFHLFTLAEHALSHTVNPWTGNFDLNLADEKQRGLVLGGLDLGFKNEHMDFGEGLAAHGGGLWSHVPGIADVSNKFTDFLFKDYLPAIKMKMALEALERNEKRYSGDLTKEQIYDLTANQSNAAFGSQNYRLLGRSPLIRDLLALTFVAPDFLFSRMKFVGQALKPYGAEQRRALFIMTAASYVLARVLNGILDDDNDPHWNWKDAFNVVYKGRRYSLRTVIQDAWHLLTDPRSFLYNRVSPIARAGIELATHKDWRGVNRNTVEQMQDVASWITPASMEGFVPGATSRETNIPESLGRSIGIMSRKDTHEMRIRELARDYNRDSNDPAAISYQKARDQETLPDSAYRKLDLLLDANDLSGALDEYTLLIKKGHKAAVIGTRYKNDRPFTGTRVRDAAFLKTLTPAQRVTFERAKQEHRDQFKRFQEMLRRRHTMLFEETLTEPEPALVE